MAITLKTELVLTGGDLLEKARRAHLSMRPLMKQIGVLGMSSAVSRLQNLKQEKGGVRSGGLMASLQAGQREKDGGNTIFKATETYAEFGTNVRHARIRHFGGTIKPKNGKALAMPLTKKLQRDQMWPRDYDPGRTKLKFVPINRGNVLGLLVEWGEEKKKTLKSGVTKFRRKIDPLYLLLRSATQEATPYMYWSDEDVRRVREELWPKHLGLA